MLPETGCSQAGSVTIGCIGADVYGMINAAVIVVAIYTEVSVIRTIKKDNSVGGINEYAVAESHRS